MQVDDRRTPDAELGPVVAEGRDAAIHDAGPGRVLRRTPGPRDLRGEAAVMEHVRRRGYPVPQVFRVGPGEMVLERIEGPTMLHDLEAHPWRCRTIGRTLAGLHEALHHLDAPADLPSHPISGPAIVHLDLHPGNVICSPSGPVVFDWTNARRALPEVDVAVTWLLMGAFEHDPVRLVGPWHQRTATRVVQRVEPWVRRALVETFLDGTGQRQAAQAVLAATATVRLEDRNVRPGEAAAIRALVERHAT